MVFDLKAIQAQWDNPVEETVPATGTGWDAPVGVPINKSTQPDLSTTDSFFSGPPNQFPEPKGYTSPTGQVAASPPFQEDRPQRGSEYTSRSTSIHQRDAYQQAPRAGSRSRERFTGKGNSTPRREPQDFNPSSNSSDSGFKKRYDQNPSQTQYSQGRGDYSNQPEFHQPDRRSNNGFNNGTASRSEYHQENKPHHSQARGRDNSRSRASSCYQEASTVSESVEPRGRTRSVVSNTGSLETCLDWINYPKDLDIFHVMDIFGRVKGKRGILLKLKNEKVARLTFESVEFAQQALMIFKQANQPGSIQPASDSEPPRGPPREPPREPPRASTIFANHQDSEYRPEKPSQNYRSSSRTSNHSSSYQRPKPNNGHQNHFRENSLSRKPESPPNNWTHSGPTNDNRTTSYSNTGAFSFDSQPETNGSEWNAPIEPRYSSQIPEVSPKFTQPSHNTNAPAASSAAGRGFNNNKATSEWDSPIEANKSNGSLEANHSFGWEAPIGVQNIPRDGSFDNKSNNWDAPVPSNPIPEWEVPKPIIRQSPTQQENLASKPKFEANIPTNSWEMPINNKTSDQHQDLHLIPEPKAPTTALISEDQKALLHSPELEPAACLAIYNYPSFSPLDDLYSCFSPSVSESAFVTPTLVYLRFNSYSNALKACQDYKVSGRQGFARVADPPHYVNFISTEELASNLSLSLSNSTTEDSKPPSLPEKGTFEKIRPEKVHEPTPPTNPSPQSTSSRHSEYPTPPPDSPIRRRVKPPTDTAPALRMIAHALGRQRHNSSAGRG